MRFFRFFPFTCQTMSTALISTAFENLKLDNQLKAKKNRLKQKKSSNK